MQPTDARPADKPQRDVPAFSRPMQEPSLADLFSDPITGMLMSADRVEYRALDELLRTKRAQLALGRRKKLARRAAAHLKALCVQLGRMS